MRRRQGRVGRGGPGPDQRLVRPQQGCHGQGVQLDTWSQTESELAVLRLRWYPSSHAEPASEPGPDPEPEPVSSRSISSDGICVSDEVFNGRLVSVLREPLRPVLVVLLGQLLLGVRVAAGVQSEGRPAVGRRLGARSLHRSVGGRGGHAPPPGGGAGGQVRLLQVDGAQTVNYREERG
ncbi:hypothetical protein EYF80_063852 [Liparis tanakae]|uniref:Uncharacterized protein n=1 Tax=Liparis tanakae TaxID=230148 RepID=A0A4Z2ECI8_9TELE|nr:hypothetical protein EYF80_063852 [Liparis tanakae]